MYTIFSAVQRQQRKSDVMNDVFWSHRLQRRLLSGSSLQVPHCPKSYLTIHWEARAGHFLMVPLSVFIQPFSGGNPKNHSP
jgi:hypothetical protein